MNNIIRDSSEEYHAKKEYVGSTALRKMEQSSRHFYHAWKNKTQEESTDSQVKGTLFHDLLLEQSVEKYVARPLKPDGDLVRSNSKEYLEFLAKNPGKTPVHPDVFNEMYGALTGFCENETAMAMMKGASIEHSIYTKDKDTGISIKARPDIWGENYICDLKTGTLDRFFEKNIFSSGWDIQLAHYAACIEAAGGPKIKNFYIIGFEQKAPYQSKTYRIRLSDIALAKDLRRGYLNEIAVCLKEGHWPGFSTDVVEVCRPEYLNNHDSLVSFEGTGK